MKILFLQDDFPPKSFGGAGIVAFNLAKAAKDRGFEVFVITAVQNREEEGVFEYEGLRVFKIYSKYHERWRGYLSLYNPQTAGKMRRIISEIEPDVVHAHNVHNYLSYYSLKLAKKAGAKVFLTAHDVMLFHYGKLIEFINKDNPSCKVKSYKVSVWQQIKRFKKRYNPFRNIMIRYYLRYVDRIFAVSNELKKALNDNGIGNVEVVHNGIDFNEWKVKEEKIEEFRKKYELGGKKIILFGGRLSEAKGGRQAILAMEEVIKKIPEATLLVMGEKNEYAEKMMGLARERGIEKNIIFTGWISGDDLKAAYYSADVVLVLSVCFDSFPTVVLEAFACRKPVLATCFGGAKEIIEDYKSGFTLNPYVVNEFSKKIIKVIEDFELLRQFGDSGYNRLADCFFIENQFKKIISYYNKN